MINRDSLENCEINALSSLYQAFKMARMSIWGARYHDCVSMTAGEDVCDQGAEKLDGAIIDILAAMDRRNDGAVTARAARADWELYCGNWSSSLLNIVSR